MSSEAFFEIVGDHYVPNPVARGFWGPMENLHARVVIGLMAYEIERRHGERGFEAVRLTADLYRLPDLSPAEVVTRVVREGGRIKVIDAEYICGGVSSARATCQILRRTHAPEGKVWSPPGWTAPHPDTLPIPQPPPVLGKWDIRPIPGPEAGQGPRQCWLRENRPLVAGVAHTPFTRLATGIDYVSPFSNMGEKGLEYINSDVTVYAHRPMTGEWVGYEVESQYASDGVAVANCTLHDLDGPLGYATCAALAQRRPAGG